MSKFNKWIMKLGESLGLTDTATKIAKTATGVSDEKANKNMESYMNDPEYEAKVDSLLGENSAYKRGKAILSGFDWVRKQAEASTGSAANETNKEIAEENLGFEREKFDYDKALQREIFEREDTANQRTVNDMRLAGLNPLNMQGTNGTGEVVSTKAPHNDFQMQSTQTLQLIDTLFNSALQAKATQSNNSLQAANANLLNAQADNQRIKNNYEESLLASQILGNRYDNQSKYWNSINQKNNYLLNKAFGWTDNMPDWMKQSSSRLGFRIFDDRTPLDLHENALGDLYNSYHPTKMNNSYFLGNGNVSQQLLSDELLMGSLGIFGNILKLLTK